MTTPPAGSRVDAERLAATVLTVQANAKHPGTVDPKNARAYVSALRDASKAFGDPHGVNPLAEHLLAVMFDLATFAAARPRESPSALVRAFAEDIATREA